MGTLFEFKQFSLGCRTKRGASVHLFERGCIGSAGASAMCNGVMTAPCFWWDSGTHKIVENSLKLYERLSQDYSIQLTKCGRVYLGETDSTVNIINRMYSRAKIWNDSAELIEDPLDISSRWPMVNADDVKLAFYSPDDLSLDPIALCHAFKNECLKM
uniref:FAD dependent oxidoreductase domain-containing protein n=1 Tax=Acrobeloides nanus TaxID=290746 RepID=A0A914ELQ8_9BILA